MRRRLNDQELVVVELLKSYYQDFTYDTPQSKVKSEWTSRNKCGFLLGIALYGQAEHVTQLQTILTRNENISETIEHEAERSNLLEAFANDMFEYYIEPFHKSYSSATPCHTATGSITISRVDSTEYLFLEHGQKGFSHNHLKKSLIRRDGVCLFCWGTLSLEAAHILYVYFN